MPIKPPNRPENTVEIPVGLRIDRAMELNERAHEMSTAYDRVHTPDLIREAVVEYLEGD